MSPRTARGAESCAVVLRRLEALPETDLVPVRIEDDGHALAPLLIFRLSDDLEAALA